MWKTCKAKLGNFTSEWLIPICLAIGIAALGVGAVVGMFALAVGFAVAVSLLKGVVPGIVLWLVWSYFDIAKDIPMIPVQYHDIALWKFILGCAAVSMVIRLITGRGLNLPKFKKTGKVGELKVTTAN